VLVDFVLSCRVFGRRIEETMLHHVSQQAALLGAREMVACFTPTAKNGPCLRFLEASGLQRDDDGTFRWSLSTTYPLPPDVELLAPAPEALA
jgi:predicted enzyme involved in methoxymalonyl-ACP biosynthesis